MGRVVVRRVMTVNVPLLLPADGRYAVAARRLPSSYEAPITDDYFRRYTALYDSGFGSWTAGFVEPYRFRPGGRLSVIARLAQWGDDL